MKDRPFKWGSKTHLRHAQNGKYRDSPLETKYYNSALNRFVSKGGRGIKGQENKDLYRTTYADGKLTPPKGYMFDMARADLVPARRLRKKSEIFRDGLIYRGRELMKEFMPTTRIREPPPKPPKGRITIEAALYGRRHPSRGESRLGEGASKKLSVFGRPVRRVGSHGTNDALMRGEQVILRELWQVVFDVEQADFAAFKRKPQENRLYLLNDDDFLHFFDLMKKAGVIKDPSMFKVIKILSVSSLPQAEPVSDMDELM